MYNGTKDGKYFRYHPHYPRVPKRANDIYKIIEDIKKISSRQIETMAWLVSESD